ncbi:hypothetical protein ACUY3K_06915 [Corynebacterium uberis]|uniref:hypothetical protein n=1 Tax=Corynebacterium TaxID=1716 RepID=UPI001D09EC08|nr:MULTISPECIES: hypothetical protein [Corynebacterium]MCZ9310263.1 hypothetical protein [Corynebacterium sp. c6VSa_13]UDL73663.1 hypothetical protein LH391_11440 [Corynebacterium uberis]UDL75456.1 hypothetical protein LH393_09485 [Corynebacterium uberis]UDL77669.1 hypothetical protein LH394_09470 [Corynebacterium uberis]UDL79953.1 hypothetical protein LH392_09895 [Corynebacterium uberis]
MKNSEEIMINAVEDGTVVFPHFQAAWYGLPPGETRTFTVPDEVRGHSLHADFWVHIDDRHEQQDWPSPTE